MQWADGHLMEIFSELLVDDHESAGGYVITFTLFPKSIPFPKDFLKLISTEERSLDMKSRWLTTWLSAYFSPTTIGLQEVDKDFINNFLGPRMLDGKEESYVWCY